MILIVAALGSILGTVASIRKEYFQVSALTHAAVLGSALACMFGWNMLLGALLVMPIRAIVIYRMESLEASLAIFGFSMGLAAYFLAISGTVAEARTILFGSLLVNDYISIEILKIFTVFAVIFLIFTFDKLIYEKFDPEAAYVYEPNLRYMVFVYYILLAFGTVILMRFLGAFLTIVVLSAPEIIFRHAPPRMVPFLYFSLLAAVFYLSLYTSSPTGISTAAIATIVGIRELIESRK